MNTPQWIPVALLLSGLVAALGTSLVSCGADPGRISGKAALELDETRLPSQSNVQTWASTWVKGEWILTVGDDPARAPSEPTWKNALARSLVESAGILQADAGFARATAELGTRLKVTSHRLGFATLPQLLQNSKEPPLGFLHVVVDGGDSFLRSIDSPFAFAADLGREETRERLALWQIQGMSDVSGVVWAEPNLLSELYDSRNTNSAAAGIPAGVPAGVALADPSPSPDAYAPPPEFKVTSLMVKILQRVRADLAWERAFDIVKEKSKAGPFNLAQVNVAVLDTGVDYFHPELKDAMFENPREIAGNGVDDDGNKHIDDVYGINATVDNSADETVEPRPGAADVGGPGQPCPVAIGSRDDELTTNCGHGTHVAGIIATKHGGNLTTLGICPSCKIISIRVSERCLQPDTTDSGGDCKKPLEAYDKDKKWEVDGGIADISQIRGLRYLFELKQKDRDDKLATNVVNMSLGKYFRSRAMSYVIRKLNDLNIIVVAAAGNDNTDTPSYPAAYDSVVSVCATGTDSHRGEFGKAIFSNYGDWVDICAPGVDIYSAVPGKDSDGNGRYISKSGTSQATPFVAGAAGYLLSVFKDSVSSEGIVRSLKASANYAALYSADYNTLYKACYAGSDICDHLLGSGMLDLGGSVGSEKNSQVDESNGRAVARGCVVSSIGAGGPYMNRQAASSLPFTLLFAWLAWRAGRAFVLTARGYPLQRSRGSQPTWLRFRKRNTKTRPA